MGSMDYFPLSIYQYSDTRPIIDNLDSRPYRHESIFHAPTQQNHGSTIELLSNKPDVDIRDTSSTYFIDIELPGISDKKSISLEWTSSRDIIISGTVSRPFVSDKLKVVTEMEETLRSMNAKDGKVVPAPGEQMREPELVADERRIGPFRRHFCFLVEVDMGDLEAKLEAGLLMIRVPKKKLGVVGGGRVNIE
jgi:HSP20 family molecular chaperone IbpA